MGTGRSMRTVSRRTEVAAPQPARVVFKSADNQSGNRSSCGEEMGFYRTRCANVPRTASRRNRNLGTGPPRHQIRAVSSHNIALISIKGGNNGRRREAATQLEGTLGPCQVSCLRALAHVRNAPPMPPGLLRAGVAEQVPAPTFFT